MKKYHFLENYYFKKSLLNTNNLTLLHYQNKKNNWNEHKTNLLFKSNLQTVSTRLDSWAIVAWMNSAQNISHTRNIMGVVRASNSAIHTHFSVRKRKTLVPILILRFKLNVFVPLRNELPNQRAPQAYWNHASLSNNNVKEWSRFHHVIGRKRTTEQNTVLFLTMNRKWLWIS